MNSDSDPQRVALQVAVAGVAEMPARAVFADWVNAALLGSGANVPPAACITIRIVDSAEGAALNSAYRDGAKPTNVLAFPAGAPVLPDMVDAEPELGDLVICYEVVVREAQEQGKQQTAHLAHLVVHGTLHLVGYDHQDDAQAMEMEGLEASIMQDLGFADPYAI